LILVFFSSISFFCVGYYITIQDHLSYRGASNKVYSKSGSWCIPNRTAGPPGTRSSSGKPAGRNQLSGPRYSIRSTASTTECKTGPRPPDPPSGARFRAPAPSRPKSHFGFLYTRVKTLAIGSNNDETKTYDEICDFDVAPSSPCSVRIFEGISCFWMSFYGSLKACQVNCGIDVTASCLYTMKVIILTSKRNCDFSYTCRHI